MYFFMDATVQATTGISSRRVAASRPKTRHSGSGRVWNPISLTAMRLVVSGGSQCPTKLAARRRPPGPLTGSSTVAGAIRTALATTILQMSRSCGMATPSRSLRTAELGECTGSSLAPVSKIWTSSNLRSGPATTQVVGGAGRCGQQQPHDDDRVVWWMPECAARGELGRQDTEPRCVSALHCLHCLGSDTLSRLPDR